MDGKLRNMTSIYLINRESMLLLYRMGSRVIADSYTGTAGGHFEKEELNDAKACVLRELTEETGLGERDIDNLSLRYITLRFKNGEIRQNYYFFANIDNKAADMASTEGRLQWFPYKDVADLDMPYTARYVIRHYVQVGRNTESLYAGIATQQGVAFVEMEDFEE